MDKVFIDKTLLKKETFLYGIQMPGFMAMCLAGRNSVEVEFAGSNIKEEEMTNENIFIVSRNNKELLNKMANLKDWDELIGIVVDIEREISIDIIEELGRIAE